MTVAWVLGILGTLGVAGTIALAIFAPALLLVIWNTIASLFNAIISNRLGCAALALIAGLAAGDIYGDLHGRSIEKAACAAREVAAEEAATKRDRDIGAAAENDDAKRVKELEDQADADAKRIKDYEDKLANRSSDACVLNDDDLRGLRRPAER